MAEFRYTTRMWFVYMLRCRGGSLYTGIAKNHQKRFREHQAGRGGAYTRSHKPLRIVFTESADSYSTALKREAEIKRWPRKKKLRMISP